jgi:hypothetical protein
MAQPAYDGIVILGAPRSGTTLLRRLINAHPRIHCPPETNLLSGAARFLHEDHFAQGLAVGVVPGLSYCDVTEAQVLDRLRAMVYDILGRVAEDAGKPIWAEKTAFDSFFIESIARLLGPRVRYVCLVRHPFDVACSIKELTDKMEMWVEELRPYVRSHASPYTAFTQAWVDIARAMLKLAEQYPDATYRLRYEDLVEHPSEQLSSLFDFLDEPTEVDALIDRAMEEQESVGLGDWKTYQQSSISGGSVGRWKTLSQGTRAAMTELAGPTMKSLGYEPDPTAEAADEAEARRQYQISLMAAQMARGSSGKGGNAS